MLERINLILKSRNLNAAQFADEIGVQRSSVSHILTGRNNASLDFILKVLKRYPEIDTDWLITGKGIMIRASSVSSVNTRETIFDEQQKPISFPLNIEKPVDFFKQPGDIKEEDQEIKITKEDKSFEEVKQLLINVEEQNKMPGEKGNETRSARQIERIVLFYSDKTFTEYKPEN